MFYFERLLDRISKSKYKDSIILKGGLLLSSIIGVDDRTTKDMDATLKGLPLEKEMIEEIFYEIFSVEAFDNVTFELVSIKDIALDKEYGGYRINILGKLGNNKTYIAVELTTGDEITPREMNYSYKCIFEDKKIPIMSYNLETVLAEKFETIISRGIFNTRLKDFYDIHVLLNNKENNIDITILNKAIKNTFERRKTVYDINNFIAIVDDFYKEENLRKLWLNYQDKNDYAKNIRFDEAINSLKKLISLLD